MQAQHYADATDFFAIFEEGDLCEEIIESNTNKGYVRVGDKKVLAMLFIYDDASCTSGMGIWDDNIL